MNNDQINYMMERLKEMSSVAEKMMSGLRSSPAATGLHIKFMEIEGLYKNAFQYSCDVPPPPRKSDIHVVPSL